MKIIKSFAALLCAAALVSVASCSGNAEKAPAEAEQQVEASEEVAPQASETPEIYQILAQTLADVEIDNSLPIVIDFNATWCVPCKKFTPIFEQAKTDYNGKAQFIEVDIDKYEELKNKFGVESIPMVVVINPAGDLQSNVGLMSQEDFYAMIDKAV